MKPYRHFIILIVCILLILPLLGMAAMPAAASSGSYDNEYGVAYAQLFTVYPQYLNPVAETGTVKSLMNAYKAALGEYGGDYDFLPSFIYALDEGGANIIAAEILAQFGLSDSTEEKLISDTSEALMREILKSESELTSVTNRIAGNFRDFKSYYNVAATAGKLQFINDLKSACKNLSDSDIDKLADKLFKRESDLMGKVEDGIEFWQLIVGIVQLQELQEESICQLRDALEDNSDFAKALDDLLADIRKDPVAHMLKYYCTDTALELLSDAVQTAFLGGRFAPSKLTIAVANIAVSIVTAVYPGAMADEVYQTTLLSSYVSELSAAVDAHRTQFMLARTRGELVGRDEIAQYEYLYSAYITTIRETLKSSLSIAKTQGQKENIKKAIILCDSFTYETYITWCMTAVTNDISAGIIAAPGSVASNAAACVKEAYPSFGTLEITKANANITDRPCSVNTDASAVCLESAGTNTDYVITGLYLNTAGNYWYQIITKSGQTGYVYSGNCEHRAFLQDVTISGLDIPSRINVGSRYFIRGTISTTYTNLTAVSYRIYDQAGVQKTGGTVNVSGKSYVLDNSMLDAAVEYNYLDAGTYHCVLEATIENHSATMCYAEKVPLDIAELVVEDIPVSKLGDADHDGEISDADAIMLNRYLVGWVVGINLSVLDIDGDSKVTDWDGILLERYLAGWDISING